MGEFIFLTPEGAKILLNARNEFYQTPGIKEFFYKENEVLIRGLEPNKKVLDVGCGLGTHLLLMHKFCNNLFGVDFSEAVLKYTRKRLEGISNIQIHNMNARHMNFESNTFDQTSCMDATIGNFEDEIQVLKEMARVTKKGGRVIFSVFNLLSIKERLIFYEKTGSKDVYLDGTTFRNPSGLYSKSYSRTQVVELCKAAGLLPKIHATRLGYVCEAIKR